MRLSVTWLFIQRRPAHHRFAMKAGKEKFGAPASGHGGSLSRPRSSRRARRPALQVRTGLNPFCSRWKQSKLKAAPKKTAREICVLCMDEKIRQLQPLSTQQLEALDENKKLRDRRTTVLKGGLIGIFVTISFPGLYLYRARAA